MNSKDVQFDLAEGAQIASRVLDRICVLLHRPQCSLVCCSSAPAMFAAEVLVSPLIALKLVSLA
jgi:hypothetical protein